MPRRRARIAALAAAALTAALLPSVQAAQAAPDRRIGSDSGGDSYFPRDGNGGYDVEHYDLKVTYRPGSDKLAGRARITLVPSEDLYGFHLDLALVADSVKVDGERAKFSKPHPHELRVVPATSLAEGRPVTVDVRYHGRPARTRTTGVSPFIWHRAEAMAMGEPQIGPWWFPGNETPSDKATYDIALRVPKGKQAISNGELLERKRSKHWTTWRWEMTDPMTTYLAFFAAGRFQVVRETAAGRPAVYAVSRQLSKSARQKSLKLLRTTPGVVDWLEEQFGPYPYRSIGGVITGVPVWFALENQSRPTYPYVGGPSRGAVSLVVHEQAHQWFGNDVTLERWSDIWLHEGFASYAEWLYAEHKWGRSTDRKLRAEYDAIPAGDRFWRVRVGDPGAARVFDDAIYVRGAMAIAALRNVVGSEALEEILRTWLQDHAGGNATGTEFRALAEEISGVELDDFFREWLDDRDRPARTRANGLAR